MKYKTLRINDIIMYTIIIVRIGSAAKKYLETSNSYVPLNILSSLSSETIEI